MPAASARLRSTALLARRLYGLRLQLRLALDLAGPALRRAVLEIRPQLVARDQEIAAPLLRRQTAAVNHHPQVVRRELRLRGRLSEREPVGLGLAERLERGLRVPRARVQDLDRDQPAVGVEVAQGVGRELPHLGARRLA